MLMREKATAVLFGALLAGSLVLSPPATADAFLKSTGARGLLAEEEEQLYRLRQMEEGKVREELLEARGQLEEEAKRSSEGKLCATPFGVDVVGITEFIALTGALVGGLSARRRKLELERLNEQLRTINMQLRQQARAGTLYAPGLTYAPTGGVQQGASSSPMATLVKLPTGAGSEVPPVGTMRRESVVKPKENSEGNNGAASADKDVTVRSNSNGAVDEKNATISLTSIDEEDMRPEVKQCQTALKEGKRFLKEKDAGPALVRFEKALMLARAMGDKVRERRAVRGLAAANRILGRYPQAIEYLQRVLEISDETGDHIGDADAYGTIADIYTELGEFEKAAEFYDKYIGKMAVEGPV
jgi:tetratricopeptide (TPR) repeat protein